MKKPDLKIDKFIKSDAKKFIEKLIKKLHKHDFIKKNFEWYNFCKNIKKTYPIAPHYNLIKNENFVDPYFL